MGKADNSNAAKIGDFLFRYMLARYRCVGGALASSRIRLVTDIKEGVRVFEGRIVISAEAWPPVTKDGEQHAFLDAIINGNDHAVAQIDPAELTAWRNYVLNHGPVPGWREPVVVGCPERADIPAKGLTVRWPSVLSALLPAGWLKRAPG